MTTISTRVSFPVGVRPLLFEDAARRRRLETRMAGLLEDSQFREVILPIVDFVEPYRGVIAEATMKQSYRFTDREGELLAIRSDFTPMLARVLAPVLAREPLPLRVFYRGDVIRYQKSRLGLNREFFQIGAEIIGTDSIENDVEAVHMAISLADSAGVRPLVTITDASIFDRLIDGAGLDRMQRIELLEAVANKRPDGVDSAAGTGGGPNIELLRRWAAGRLDFDGMRGTPVLRPVAERLLAVEESLARRVEATVILALDDVEPEGYYSGIRFRLFRGASRTPVGNGGRYDGPFRRFGAEVSAVGFTLSVDDLEEER